MYSNVKPDTTLVEAQYFQEVLNGDLEVKEYEIRGEIIGKRKHIY